MNCLTFNYGGFTQKALAQLQRRCHWDERGTSTKPLLKVFVVDFLWFSLRYKAKENASETGAFTRLCSRSKETSGNNDKVRTEPHLWFQRCRYWAKRAARADHSLPYSPKYISVIDKINDLLRQTVALHFAFVPLCSRMCHCRCCKNRVGWETEISAYN